MPIPELGRYYMLFQWENFKLSCLPYVALINCLPYVALIKRSNFLFLGGWRIEVQGCNLNHSYRGGM